MIGLSIKIGPCYYSGYVVCVCVCVRVVCE